jgi:hypothetical protein
MEVALARKVRRRAGNCCEYCRMPERCTNLTFEIDHVVARKHGGATEAHNLALACPYCNSYKGTDIATIDPKSRRLVRLFNPRRNRWDRHFRWIGPVLVGRTSVGRVTVAILNINDIYRVMQRRTLIAEGQFPPE